MLMQRLKEFAEADTFDQIPRLYSRRPIRYVIDLDNDGLLLDPEPTDTSDASDRQRSKGAVRVAPFLARSRGIRPLLLADNAHYTLGMFSEGMSPDRTRAMHNSYLALVDRCGQATGLSPVQAIHRFLDADGPGLSLPRDFDARDSITFRVNGKYPIDFPEVRQYWASEAATRATRELQCLVCGDAGPALDHLTKKLKAIPGGHAAGSSFTSANRPAFESYGLKSTHNAPMCPDCGEKVTGAANDLLLDESSNISFASAKVVIWTRQEAPIDWPRILDLPDQTEVLAHIRRLSSGVHRSGVEDVPIYCAIFSGSGGRVAIRDWFETTIGLAERNLLSWFSAHDTANARQEESMPLSIHALAGATVRNLKDVTPSVVTSLVRCALLGTGVPLGLLHMVVSRNRSERRVTRPRAALTRLALTGATCPDNRLAGLDRSNHTPAYLCGRLLAAMGNAELACTGATRSSMVDRNFAMASTSPSGIFDRLQVRFRQHLQTVRRQSTSACRAIERSEGEILGFLPRFPAVLNLEEQGLFGLGFYHQRVDILRQMRGLSDRSSAPTTAPSCLDGVSL